jgi:hypothetical protein
MYIGLLKERLTWYMEPLGEAAKIKRPVMSQTTLQENRL